MDPAICIEAEEARLSQCVSDARENVLKAARRLAEQHAIIGELERIGDYAAAAKHELAMFSAAQQAKEDHYDSCLRRLNRALGER
jgi:hypothetical protein